MALIRSSHPICVPLVDPRSVTFTVPAPAMASVKPYFQGVVDSPSSTHAILCLTRHAAQCWPADVRGDCATQSGHARTKIRTDGDGGVLGGDGGDVHH